MHNECMCILIKTHQLPERGVCGDVGGLSTQWGKFPTIRQNLWALRPYSHTSSIDGDNKSRRQYFVICCWEVETAQHSFMSLLPPSLKRLHPLMNSIKKHTPFLVRIWWRTKIVSRSSSESVWVQAKVLFCECATNSSQLPCLTLILHKLTKLFWYKQSMIWMFTCVNLFDKGRRIKGWVPPDALAVAVAAGQHCHQHQHCHQPVHGQGGQLLSTGYRSLVLQVAWFGPGGLYGPVWAGPWQCARLTDPPPQLGGCCTDAATAGSQSEWTHGGTQSGQRSSCPGWEAQSGQQPTISGKWMDEFVWRFQFVSQLFGSSGDSSFPLTRPLLACHPFVQMNVSPLSPPSSPSLCSTLLIKVQHSWGQYHGPWNNSWM